MPEKRSAGADGVMVPFKKPRTDIIPGINDDPGTSVIKFLYILTL